MKKLLGLLLGLFLITGSIEASSIYYFAANGNDANNGTIISTPYQTINKFNTLFATAVPGDKFLFNKGDIFYGTLSIIKSGTAAANITIGAYGTGANPVLTGFTNITAWTNIGSNIWESTFTFSALSSCNMVTINGVNTGMGRFPQTGYLTYQSGTSTSLTSSSLGATDWTGATAVIRDNNSSTVNATILSQSGTTINYTATITGDVPQAGFGFFIQNDARTLTYQNAWYYNPSTKKIRIYSTSMPANVQVSTLTDIVTINARSFITFNGVDFTGGNNDIFNAASGTNNNITITNCSFGFCGSRGYEDNSASNVVISNNTITDCGQTGIFCLTNAYIDGNTVYNSGMIQGQSTWDNRNVGIFCTGSGATITHNIVRNTGSHGIVANGAIVNCSYNYIDSTVLVNNDNGGLYCNKAGTYRYYYHNIISNTIGNPAGTPTPTSYRAVGLYLDESCTHVVAIGNTIFNSNADGIKLHISFNNRLDSNTVYNCKENQLRIQGGSETVADTLRYNIYVARNFSSSSKQQWIYNISSSGLASMGIWDFNYLVRPLENNNITTANGTDRTLAAWKSAASPLDANSNATPKIITDVNDLRIEYNATKSSVTITLDANYIDARNTAYNGSITLASYTGVVLIKNGAIVTIPATSPHIIINHSNILRH